MSTFRQRADNGTYMNTDEQYAAGQRHQHEILEFYEALSSAGWIVETSCGDLPKLAAFQGTTLHCFKSARKEFVEVPASGAIGGLKDFDITMAKYSQTVVTGIRSEGKDPEAEARICRAPTEMYATLTKLKYPFSSRYMFANEPDIPSQDDVSGCVNQTYRFAKYDDGWRIVHF
jgi:hypothetical protein